MGVFFALFFYLLAIGLFSYNIKDRKKRRKFQTCFSGLGMWLVLAFRSPLCGVDLYDDTPGNVSYYSVFNDVQNYSLLECLDFGWMLRTGMDVGWIYYNKILSIFTSSFQMLLIVTSFVEIYLISRIIYKYSSHIILSFIVFFTMGLYLVSFSVLRQSIAFAITSFSFIYLYKRKYVIFSMLVVLAAFIHFSAIVFLVMYPLSKIKMTKRMGLWALVLIILAIPFLKIIVQTIVSVFLGGLRSAETDNGGAYTLLIIYVFIYMMTLFLRPDSMFNDYLRKFMLLAVAGQSLGAISTGHHTRIAFYFSIFFILTIPLILDKYIKIKYRKVSLLILSFFLFSFFYYVSKDGYLNVVPYSFFWEQSLLDY